MDKVSKAYSCKYCETPFIKRLSTDRYCSYKCASSDRKPIKRTEIKRTVSKSNKYYEKVRELLRDNIIDEDGYYSCENCGASSTVPLEIHHIFYRSEVPNHRHLNHPSNLIMCCRQCHEYFHYSKGNRKRLVEERGLEQLFSDKNDRYSKAGE